MATLETTTPRLTAEDLVTTLGWNGFIIDWPSLEAGVICADYDGVGLVVAATLDAEVMLFDDRALDGVHAWISIEALSGVVITREWLSERIGQGCSCPDCGGDAEPTEEGQISFRELEVIALADELMTFEGLDADPAFVRARADVDSLRWFCLAWDAGTMPV